MLNLFELLQQYGNLVYAIVILLGGRWGVRNFSLFRRARHNFLLFATLFAAIFMALEAIGGSFDKTDLIRYFLTYTVTTSCYELFLNKLFKEKV